MAVSFIPTIGRSLDNADAGRIADLIRSDAVYPADQTTKLYAGWPQVKDYNGRTHIVDLATINEYAGVKLVKVSLASDWQQAKKDAASIAQAAATTDALMSKSLQLKKKRRLIFDVVPILYAPSLSSTPPADEEVEIATSEAALIRLLQEHSGALTALQLNEAQAILEGAKALGQMTEVEEDTLLPIARAYRDLEAVIYNFDAAQRAVALTAIKGPQRIRGLAGTGKTVILAMKAALAHIDNPSAKVLVTYYTRSLRDVIERLITRFYRHFTEVDPNWDNVHVRHGWGRANTPGVYRDTCIREGIAPISFGEVKTLANPFGSVCSSLLARDIVTPFYDTILVDEGQDFPDSFYQLCFHLAKGSRDEKQIIWAYDELQNVFDVTVRKPEQLFGLDSDGEPRVSLARSLPAGTDTNDFVLQRSYRNQREVLVLAHALGFGVYGDPVQMLENARHWEDVGYEVVSGTFKSGDTCVVERPLSNSPSVLQTPENTPLISLTVATDLPEEVLQVAAEIRKFIDSGLHPHEIMVVSLDDRVARSYFRELSKSLSALSIPANNIIADPYSEPPFRIDGKVTLSTVYRAKGNEAAVVFVIGSDAATLRTRTGRNKLFVALTRTKGWLRIFGIDSKTLSQLKSEIIAALKLIPRIEFVMPDMTSLNTIQRGLEAKHIKLLEARRRFDKIKAELDLSDNDMISLLDDQL